MSTTHFHISPRPPEKPEVQPSPKLGYHHDANAFNRSMQHHERAAVKPVPRTERTEDNNVSTRNLPRDRNASRAFNYSMQRHERGAVKSMPKTEGRNASIRNLPRDRNVSRVSDEEEKKSMDEPSALEASHAETNFPANLEAEAMFTKKSETTSAEGLFEVVMASSGESPMDQASAAMSLEDFSAALDQAVQNRLLSDNKEWHFSISLPHAQVTLTATAAARWSVGIFSSQADSKSLAKYTDELKSRLKDLGQTIEGIEIVKESTR